MLLLRPALPRLGDSVGLPDLLGAVIRQGAHEAEERHSQRAGFGPNSSSTAGRWINKDHKEARSVRFTTGGSGRTRREELVLSAVWDLASRPFLRCWWRPWRCGGFWPWPRLSSGWLSASALPNFDTIRAMDQIQIAHATISCPIVLGTLQSGMRRMGTCSR